ncbi:MAG: DUF3887 domain-containing protein [Methanomicrobia archaeon]|nr:DUF3887 domain-containing protein [Methanomicrobia archaeon]
MSRKKVRLLAIAGSALFAVIFMGGCLNQTPVDIDQVRSYADPITENILIATTENNYTKYSEHFDATMKNALPESLFLETNAMIKSKIGTYDSKEFWKAERKNQYIIVYYKARFTQEPAAVIVKVVFQELEGDMKISGLWFDSPRLRS